MYEVLFSGKNLPARQEVQIFTGSLSTDAHDPQTVTGSQFFSFLEHFDAITFVTSSHRHPTRAFPIRYEEQKCAKKRKHLTFSCRPWLTTSVLKFPIHWGRRGGGGGSKMGVARGWKFEHSFPASLKAQVSQLIQQIIINKKLIVFLCHPTALTENYFVESLC